MEESERTATDAAALLAESLRRISEAKEEAKKAADRLMNMQK